MTHDATASDCADVDRRKSTTSCSEDRDVLEAKNVSTRCHG